MIKTVNENLQLIEKEHGVNSAASAAIVRAAHIQSANTQRQLAVVDLADDVALAVPEDSISKTGLLARILRLEQAV